MLRKFWLLFAQACTLCLAALFVVATLRPDLLPRFTQKVGNIVLMQQSAPAATSQFEPSRNTTFADAAKKAMPAVVNIYSSKVVRSRNPVLDDSILKRYFPELAERTSSRRATNLGSGVIGGCGTDRATAPVRDAVRQVWDRRLAARTTGYGSRELAGQSENGKPAR